MIGKRKAARRGAQSERVVGLLTEVNQLRALIGEMLAVRRPTAAQRDEWRQRAGIPEDAPS